MTLTRTKTLLLASSIALLTTPAYAWTNEAHGLSGRVEFTDANAKRRHHAKPRQAKARYAKSTKTRHAKHQQVKHRSVERQSRPTTARQPAGYDAFASLPVQALPDQHGVVRGYYAPMSHTPTRIKQRAVERQSRPQRARQHAGYDTFASLPDQHAIDQGYYYPQARRTPAPYASTRHAPPPTRSATRSHRVARTSHTASSTFGSDLVARARQYMGTNPTGWARVWCGRFMAMIAPDAAKRIGNPNFALNWAKLPRTGLHIGAIAVLSRNGGGHVGVVSGIDANGNPIIISGNHNRRVAEAVYPRSRVYAYVRP